MKIPLRVPSFRVDWPNHIIGFFSALFGILIAFQLDEWRDQRAQKELVAAAYTKLRDEAEGNRVRLSTNINNNLELIRGIEQLLTLTDNNFQFTGTLEQADSINTNHSNFAFIEKGNAGEGLSVRIKLYELEIPVLESAAWESSKATGALNFMEYEWVTIFSSLYNSPQIMAEIEEIRDLWRKTDDSRSKKEFLLVLTELKKAHGVILRRMPEYDQWLSIVANLQ